MVTLMKVSEMKLKNQLMGTIILMVMRVRKIVKIVTTVMMKGWMCHLMMKLTPQYPEFNESTNMDDPMIELGIFIYLCESI